MGGNGNESEENMNEKIRLLEKSKPRQNPNPNYVFESAWHQKRKRVKQFQCCLCSIFLFALILAGLGTISYELNYKNDSSSSVVDNLLVNLNVPLLELNVDDDSFLSMLNNEELCKRSLEEGIKGLDSRDKFEDEQLAILQKNTPSYRHQMVTATSNKSRNLTRIGFAENYATYYYYYQNASLESKNQSNQVLFNCSYTPTAYYCFVNNSNCNKYYKYRSFNGTCNNLKYGKFGVAYTPFRRLLKADYADGISSPRKSKSRDDLPSARTISLIVHRPYYKDDPKFTVMLAVWGQFLDHDLTATALTQTFKDGHPISCCDEHGNVRKNLHPECFPVKLDEEDPYYKKYNVTCMEFVRSAAAPTCKLGQREQLNQATAYLDGSVVYGNDEETANNLRLFKNGLLKMYVTEDNRTLLPVSDNFNDGCNREEQASKGRYCFISGDSRANENLHLTSMHLLWARHHNNLALNLQALNPHWDDERLFQESRRILVAQMQHITYNEFLPILLGEELMKKHELEPLPEGYYEKYDEEINPGMANCFVASAFRFAHTLIPSLIKFLSNNSENGEMEYKQLHEMLFDPFKLYERGGIDGALSGAMKTKIQASDPYFSNELKEHLFEFEGSFARNSVRKVCGLDLVSLNIQRGRDHGLPGYTSWRERCGLPRPRSFKDLNNDVDDESLRYISSIYRDVDDIDLYTGALSEKPRKGAILGPTITCLILDQFVRLKRADRFWYENKYQFTPQQLNQLRKTKLSNVICENSDGLKQAQTFVMKNEKTNQQNQMKNCKDLEKPNLQPWKENLNKTPIKNDSSSIKIIL